MKPRWTPWLHKELDKLTADDLKRLKEDEVSESYFVEYKSQWDGFKVARSIASFANTEGGTVVVGVEDDNMVPVAVDGVQFAGNLLESVDQAVRRHVTPAPMYSSVVVPLSEDRACLVVEVPSGYDTPYVLVDKGQILERSNTSSDPVPPQNRERIRELFDRGKRGKVWADKFVEQELSSDESPQHLRVWTIPQVDGGLNLNSVLYRPSFVERATALTPVPFAHGEWHPTYETPGFHLRIRHSLSYQCTTDIRLDAILFTGWSLTKDTSWVNVRPDLPDFPVEEDNFFYQGDLSIHISPMLLGHRQLLGELIGYTGSVTVVMKVLVNGDRSAAAHRSNLPLDALGIQGFHDSLLRDIERDLGRTLLDPEDEEASPE